MRSVNVRDGFDLEPSFDCVIRGNHCMAVRTKSGLTNLASWHLGAHGVTWFPAVAPVIRGLYGD